MRLEGRIGPVQLHQAPGVALGGGEVVAAGEVVELPERRAAGHVVDHGIEDHGDAVGVGGIDQAREVRGVAVAGIGRRLEHGVVAPAVVGRRGHGHQLDGVDAQVQQVGVPGQPGLHAGEGAVGAEIVGCNLVDDQARAVQRLGQGAGAREDPAPHGVPVGGIAVDPVRHDLARAGVGQPQHLGALADHELVVEQPVGVAADQPPGVAVRLQGGLPGRVAAVPAVGAGGHVDRIDRPGVQGEGVGADLGQAAASGGRRLGGRRGHRGTVGAAGGQQGRVQDQQQGEGDPARPGHQASSSGAQPIGAVGSSVEANFHINCNMKDGFRTARVRDSRAAP